MRLSTLLIGLSYFQFSLLAAECSAKRILAGVKIRHACKQLTEHVLHYLLPYQSEVGGQELCILQNQ